ncbi:MAG: hypothetical protein ACR2G6_11240 [Gemmatimonadaceae bacterium]
MAVAELSLLSLNGRATETHGVMATGVTDMGFSDVEEEVVLLKAIDELVDSMVNFEMLSLHGSDPDSEIRFKTVTHQCFFNIILVDFLSSTDREAATKQTSYLGALRHIVAHPGFDVNGSVRQLRDAAHQFVDWLDREVEVDVWLPAIGTQTTLKISRVSFLKMCGNISKHNFLRSVRVAKQLQEALAANGHSMTLEDSLLALSDFYERFHTDILNYHSSTVAEFLNNIRWGIYQYLQPEFHRSIVREPGDPPKYRYTYPVGVTSGFAKECYWELMNEVRSFPYVRRFEVTKWLKLRY